MGDGNRRRGGKENNIGEEEIDGKGRGGKENNIGEEKSIV